MDINEQLRKPTLDQEPYFYINSDQLEKDLTVIKQQVIENLFLTPNERGYKLDNVDFLKEVPFVKKIQMGACKEIKNFEGLSYLKSLNHLTFSAGKKVTANLSTLIYLKELHFKYTPKIIGLDKLINLELLSVDSGNEAFFNDKLFMQFKNLKKLFIMLSKIKNLNFLKENQKLEYLEFNYMKAAFDLEGILFLKDSLKKLKFISSKKVNNINLISELENLEWLILSNSVTIENADVVSSLKKLEALTMYGSSYFINGDLRNLNGLRKNIKNYNVENKKHYFYE